MLLKFSPINIQPTRKNKISSQSPIKENSQTASQEHSAESLNCLANINKARIATSSIEKINPLFPKHTKENYKACLIGGAVGDALGNPVEFLWLDEIKRTYGKDGIKDMVLNRGKAEITDDTQMTIFTADGLLKSALTNFDENSKPNMSCVYSSYQDWLKTQMSPFKENKKGWLANISNLYSRRAPGNTCLGSLINGIPGSIENPQNKSKGCGGVMRVAPVGLMYYKNPELAFEIGAQCAALTHGSADAYLPAGIHSSIIAQVIQGKTIEEAVDGSIEILKKYKNHENVLGLLNNAKYLASSDFSDENAIRALGEGWHGDEAIAIATYCILKYPNNFEQAVEVAVNHSGDSDSTGSIVGNILGASLGENAIPKRWTKNLELQNELSTLANDLFVSPKDIEDSQERYPIN